MNRLETKIAEFIKDKNLDEDKIDFIKHDCGHWYHDALTDEQVDDLVEVAYKTVTADFYMQSTEYIAK